MDKERQELEQNGGTFEVNEKEVSSSEQTLGQASEQSASEQSAQMPEQQVNQGQSVLEQEQSKPEQGKYVQGQAVSGQDQAHRFDPNYGQQSSAIHFGNNANQSQPMPGQGQPMPGQGQPMPGQGQPMPGQGQPQQFRANYNYANPGNLQNGNGNYPYNNYNNQINESKKSKGAIIAIGVAAALVIALIVVLIAIVANSTGKSNSKYRKSYTNGYSKSEDSSEKAKSLKGDKGTVTIYGTEVKLGCKYKDLPKNIKDKIELSDAEDDCDINSIKQGDLIELESKNNDEIDIELLFKNNNEQNCSLDECDLYEVKIFDNGIKNVSGKEFNYLGGLQTGITKEKAKKILEANYSDVDYNDDLDDFFVSDNNNEVFVSFSSEGKVDAIMVE
ncbi:hypothetical protein SAMN04487761_10770 [Lachnospiraceae bacterium C7]|nr:hypothetical protein SAMN04487761_10770 [Lachnospiraceae bacterium C7]